MLLTIDQLMQSVKGQVELVNTDYIKRHFDVNVDIIVDVREPDEYKQKPWPSSINVPRGILEMVMLQRFSFADKNIYLHCASGLRAMLAAQQLTAVGFTQVRVLNNTIDELLATKL